MIQKAIESLEAMKVDLIKEKDKQERDMEILEENVSMIDSSIASVDDTLHYLGEVDQSVEVVNKFKQEKKK